MSDHKIVLPELGEGVTEGELVKWLVTKGDSIKIDQPVVEMMTDKAAMEVPSPVAGVVESFSAKAGDIVEVGQELLTLKAANKEAKAPKPEVSPSLKPEVSPSLKPEASSSLKPEASSSLKPEVSPSLKPEVSSSLKPEASSSLKPEVSSLGALASPFTRRLARELGVNLGEIKGSGLAGRITKEDVMKHTKAGVSSTEASSASPLSMGFLIPKAPGQERKALKGIRKKIAEKMQASKTVIPHFTLLESADVEQLYHVRKSAKELLQDQNIKVTYLSFIMKALLQTLKEFPKLNASIDDFSKEIVTKNYYNFGFAADTPSGLLVPVVKDVDQKSISEISQEIQGLAEKAREGRLLLDEMGGGTVTITNIGSLGGEYATPIINAPEVAILGMYRMSIKPVWDGEVFKPRKTMNFSLTCDHRLIDGAESARALQFFIKRIESPLNIFI